MDPVMAPRNLAELNRLGGRLRDVQQRAAKAAERKKAALATVNDRYNPVLDGLATEEYDLLEAIINYAMANKDELTGGTQTIRLHNIDIEWRTDGKGTLVFIASEDDVIAKLERLKGGKDFVAVKKSVKKDPVKADPTLMRRLRGLVEVEYNDTVSVTTKPTAAQAKKVLKKSSENASQVASNRPSQPRAIEC